MPSGTRAEVLSSTQLCWGSKVSFYHHREFSETLDLMSLVVNTVTNKVARLLGKDETVRWMNLAIYQGQPAKKSLNTVVSIPPSKKHRYSPDLPQAMAASSNPLLAEKSVRDPTLFCTGHKRQRFYMFTRSDPE